MTSTDGYRSILPSGTSQPHWLRATKSDWSPDVVVCFDTETVEHADGPDKVLTLRCWDATARLRHGKAPAWPRGWKGSGETAAELCDFLVDASGATGEAWALAHNLGFDLAVTAAPLELAKRGWDLDACSIGDDSTWWAMKRDGHRIVLADSWSWLVCSLDVAARDIGRRKVRLPGNDAPLSTWHRRCRQDVALLDELIGQMLDWWDAERIGRWGITGASTGWAAMRRQLHGAKVLVGPDDLRTATEREAQFGGRREVWRIGKFTGTFVADWDFELAHLRIAAHHLLPERPAGRFDRMGDDEPIGPDSRTNVIARCTVSTDRPVAPCRIGDDIWWPDGTFATVLTGPEITFARAQGAKVDVHSGWRYVMGYALRDWAAWTLSLLAARSDQVPPPVRRMAKGWARSVVGRFASHSSRVVESGRCGAGQWELEPGRMLGTNQPFEILRFAGREMTIYHDLDGPDCFPAVTAFVESYCRVALGEMLAARPANRLLQCNTDGWWETRAALSEKERPAPVPLPHNLVRKALVRSVMVWGPNHVAGEGWRRLAGVAADATKNDAGGWSWHDWPTLRTALGDGAPGTYRRPGRKLTLAQHYARRWVLTTGETVNPTAVVDRYGVNALVPWAATLGRLEGDELAPAQDPRLDQLRGEEPYPPVILHQDGYGVPGRAETAG